MILDGFDEMSKELDPGTVTKNIHDLIDCCNARVFDGCKILITSRTHFFETGDAPRLLQRLEGPLVLQLSGIPRGQVLGYLQDAAKGPEEQELLQRMAAMHDPIGLGAKPLFLQMLKQTLHELPQDLDEVSVYESYARKSLQRKVDLLDDPELRSSRDESIQHLMSGLGVIAEELQCSKTPYVSLKSLRYRTGPFAELLWRLTGEEQLESDAQARIGTRSLLSRVNATEGDGQWLVDFCHRSIREYFVARQLVDCLAEGHEPATEFLIRVPVNHEILYFTACLIRRFQGEVPLRSLCDLISHSRAGDDEHGLGGKALTVLLRAAKTLPCDLRLTGRNFDHADLEDSDISGLDFSGSTFRRANFANTRMENADLSQCDLTDVRLHETTAVLAVTARSPSRVFAAYEDGSIWEWETGAGEKNDSRIVFSQQGLRMSRLGLTSDGVPWGIAGRELLLFEMSQSEWSCMARIPLSQTCADVTAGDRLLAVLQTDKKVRCSVVDLEEYGVTLQVPMEESSVFSAPEAGLLCLRENETAVRLVGSIEGSDVDIQIPAGNAMSIHAVARSVREILVAVGASDGTVKAFAINAAGDSVVVTPLFEKRIHSAPISSVTFADFQTIVSGGTDRMIALTHLSNMAATSRRFQLSLRCKGLKTDGIKPDAQRKRLDELRSNLAESI